jgi:hypothetical protein
VPGNLFDMKILYLLGVDVISNNSEPNECRREKEMSVRVSEMV